jgi:hypothetical protein
VGPLAGTLSGGQVSFSLSLFGPLSTFAIPGSMLEIAKGGTFSMKNKLCLGLLAVVSGAYLVRR